MEPKIAQNRVLNGYKQHAKFAQLEALFILPCAQQHKFSISAIAQIASRSVQSVFCMYTEHCTEVLA